MMKKYLLASDFDQTPSFKDSGIALSELLGISGFREWIARFSLSTFTAQLWNLKDVCLRSRNLQRRAGRGGGSI